MDQDWFEQNQPDDWFSQNTPSKPIAKLAPIKSSSNPIETAMSPFDNLIKTVGDFYNDSPVLQRLISGEADGDRPEGVTDMKGPGLMPIPGLKSGIDKLADKIDNPLGERGALRGFAAGALQGVGSLFEGGFDPRTAGIKSGGAIVLPELRETPKLNPIPETRGAVRPDDYPIPGDIKQSTGVVDLGPEDYKLHPIEQKKAQGEQILRDALAKKAKSNEPNIQDALNAVIKHDGDLNKIQGLTTEQIFDYAHSVDDDFADKLKPINKAPDEPSFAKTAGGIKIGADIESLGKVLGSSLYKGDISKIATKELLQNSMDAVRHLGAKGEVSVKFEEGNNPFVQVTDNGKGLTRQELETVFTDLGSSGKRNDSSAVGGFGLAKAAPLLGGERVEVTSFVRESDGKLYKHHFNGTPDELLKGVDIDTQEIPDNEFITTGTTVRTYVPKGSYFSQAKEFVSKLAKYSNLGGNLNLDHPGDHTTNYQPAIEKFSPQASNGKVIANLSNDYADVELTIPHDEPRKNVSSIKLQVANNGMWQTTKGQWLGADVPNIPENIIVNVKSKVSEGDRNYPFTANREELRGGVENLVNDYITENVVKPSISHRQGEIQQIYDDMPAQEIPTKKGWKPFHVLDVGGRYTEPELRNLLNNKSIQSLATQISDAVHDSLQILGNQKWIDSVEKVGFVFDESDKHALFGLNVPNPTTKKHAILINPFSTISRSKTPEQAASGLSHVILHELAHEGVRSEDAAFTASLAEVYRKIGINHEYKIGKRILDAIRHPEFPDEFNPDIQGLLQQYTETRGRAETIPDLLTGTASQSADRKPDGKGKVPSNSGPLKSRIAAVERLVEAIKAAKPIREEQEASYSAERAGRFKAARKYSGKGLAGFYKQLSKMKGEYEKLDFEHIELDQEDVDNLINMVDGTPGLMDGQKLRAKIGIMKLLGEAGGQVPQRSELKLLDQVFGDGFSNIVEMHGGLGGPVKLTNELVNLPKSIQASVDFSAPLRQGLQLIHKKAFYTSLGPMFQAWASEDAYRDLIQTIHNRPLYNLGEDAGLSITDRLSQPEEQFVSGLAERIEASIPGYRNIALITRSDRAYTAFLDKLRADTFDDLIRQGVKMGHTPQSIAPGLAKYINTATGRAKLPGNLERVAQEMNTVFFSPRLIFSRLQALNPKYYASLPPFVRKEALKSLFAVAAAGSITLGLAELGGQTGIWRDPEEESSPINSDFGKAKFGKTRLDPWGGFQQPIVAAMKFIRGEATSTISGKTTKFGSSYTAPTRLSTIGRFAQSKLSPAAAFVVNLLLGKDFEGNPINKSNETLKLFIPLITSDLYDIAKEDPKLLPLGINAAFGQGVQTYKNNPKSGLLRGVGVLRP